MTDPATQPAATPKKDIFGRLVDFFQLRSTPSLTLDPTELQKLYLDDITLMLGYCRGEGIALPNTLATRAASVFEGKVHKENQGNTNAGSGTQSPGEGPPAGGTPPASGALAAGAVPMAGGTPPTGGVPAPGEALAEHEERVDDLLAEIMYVHGLLCGVTAPATPRSLRATTSSLRNPEFLIIVGLVLYLFATGVIGLVGYIVTVSSVVTPGSPGTASTALVKPLFLLAWLGISPTQQNFIYAAALGASLYGLLTAQDYLKNRSFDPVYFGNYWIRWFVGLLSGVALANFGANLIGGNTQLSQLGPGIIALLGGYSAEAVRQILDRLVEVLVTAVQGQDPSGDKQRLDVAKDVLSVSQVATANSATPAEVKEKLDGLLNKLKQ